MAKYHMAAITFSTAKSQEITTETAITVCSHTFCSSEIYPCHCQWLRLQSNVSGSKECPPFTKTIVYIECCWLLSFDGVMLLLSSTRTYFINIYVDMFFSLNFLQSIRCEAENTIPSLAHFQMFIVCADALNPVISCRTFGKSKISCATSTY